MGGPEVDPVAGLTELILAADIFRAAVAQRYGTGVREAEAIGHLTRLGDLSAGQLAAELRVSPATVTDLVDRLERAGFAGRVPDPTSRRRVLIRATEAAHADARDIRAALAQVLPGRPSPQTLSRAFDGVAAGLRAQAALMDSERESSLAETPG